ncbi:hypothetical protein AB0A69_09625 [Streptomyces sp. NPDC045431]|uniref:hypothetical protein n=1 Tax=Streptomyces sp. NPDC045431 TaxID=3155613 RepID=UPI0033E67B59
MTQGHPVAGPASGGVASAGAASAGAASAGAASAGAASARAASAGAASAGAASAGAASAGAASGGAAAVRTLVAVLGAGTLLLPAALAPAPHAPAVAVALAAALAGWCLLLAASGGTRAAGPVAFVRDRLGPGAGRTVTALYFGGFATGQAAVALSAGEFAARAWGPVGTPVPYAVAAVVLVTAAVAARSGAYLLRRVRLAAVLVLAGAWWALGGLPAPAGHAPSAHPALLAVPLLFGWVGLESAVPAARAKRRVLAGTLLGVGLAAALYALLLAPPAPAPPAVSALLFPPLALVSALVCWTYCRTNLRATGARWAELTSGHQAADDTSASAPGGRRGAVVAALVALAVLGLAHTARWGVPALLLGPGAATAALYALLALAALRRPVTHPTEEDHDHHHRPLEGAARPAG